MKEILLSEERKANHRLEVKKLKIKNLYTYCHPLPRPQNLYKHA